MLKIYKELNEGTETAESLKFETAVPVFLQLSTNSALPVTPYSKLSSCLKALASASEFKEKKAFKMFIYFSTNYFHHI